MSQVASSVRLEMGEIMVNRAFTGVLRKYLTSLQSAQKGKPAEHTDDADIALGSIDLIVTTQDVQQSPSIESLSTKCADVSSKYLHDAETQAQRTAHNMMEGEVKEVTQEETVHTWDYVSPVAITEEYLESMYRCVSSI